MLAVRSGWQGFDVRHENGARHPYVLMDDYEVCDTIDDYLTEDCDFNDEFLF